jgi:hypothetical protein
MIGFDCCHDEALGQISEEQWWCYRSRRLGSVCTAASMATTMKKLHRRLKNANSPVYAAHPNQDSLALDLQDSSPKININSNRLLHILSTSLLFDFSDFSFSGQVFATSVLIP